MLYEGILLFGIVFAAGLLFAVIMQQRHALQWRFALEMVLFLVIGLYFIWCWTHGGQTLPMKTWRIRLVNRDGSSVRFARALLRYVLAWMWIVPGLVAAWLIGANGWMLVFPLAVNMLLWGLAGHLTPDRQFLHDRLAGTRLIKAEYSPAV